MKICKNLEEKNHDLVHGILEYYTSEKYSIIKKSSMGNWKATRWER